MKLVWIMEKTDPTVSQDDRRYPFSLSLPHLGGMEFVSCFWISSHAIEIMPIMCSVLLLVAI